MRRQFKFGDRVTLGGVEVMVTRANDDDTFGTTPHYGFQWQENDKWEQGWMPVVMFEQFASK